MPSSFGKYIIYALISLALGVIFIRRKKIRSQPMSVKIMCVAIIAAACFGFLMLVGDTFTYNG